MVSTHLKNNSQIGSFPQVGMKIKNIWNHQLENYKNRNAVFFVDWMVVDFWKHIRNNTTHMLSNPTYCWWKKSQATTWDVEKPSKMG